MISFKMVRHQSPRPHVHMCVVWSPRWQSCHASKIRYCIQIWKTWLTNFPLLRTLTGKYFAIEILPTSTREPFKIAVGCASLATTPARSWQPTMGTGDSSRATASSARLSVALQSSNQDHTTSGMTTRLKSRLTYGNRLTKLWRSSL